MDLFREAPVGQLIRLVTGNRMLQYPEERPDFSVPSEYLTGKTASSDRSTPRDSSSIVREKGNAPIVTPAEVLTTIKTNPDRVKVAQADVENALEDAARQETIQEKPTEAVTPQVTNDGRILVDWYTTDDPANPQNWSGSKKLAAIMPVYIYTLSVYIGSSIFTPSIPYIIEELNVSSGVASLGLSMYVLGYGVGPLLWSPLSEVPVIGRNPPYLITFAIFVIISIPAAFVNNFAALVVLRFLQGFFGAPALATGGASVADLYSFMQMPYYLTWWAAFATAGPGLGPLVSGFSVPAENWHWSLYEMIWLAAPVLVLMFLFLPETSAQNILLRRAARLRKLTGNTNLVSESEIKQSNMHLKDVVIASLWRPLQINALDPAIGFSSLYIGLIYGIFYSFFEAFPIVYGSGQAGTPTHGYGMGSGAQGLVFLAVPVGLAIAVGSYIAYLYYIFNPSIMKNGFGAPEQRLVPGLYASIVAPVGLFIFAWTGFNSPQVHWIVPTMGVSIYIVSIFTLFQAIFIYIPLTYTVYSASLFAGNSFFRCSFAAAAIHFAHPLFDNLGIGRGVSLLGGLMFGGIIGIFFLYYRGAWLRSRSRFAVS